MPRYRRSYRRSSGAARAARHIADRHALSALMGGIDRDVEQIFLNLPADKLEQLLKRYGKEYGESKLSYAQFAYPQWKAGRRKMSGTVAERLLNLVPMTLEAGQRFELVKKLRAKHLHKETKWVECSPAEWRAKVGPVVNDLVANSKRFQLPQNILDRVKWLADGDTQAAQQLLAAAEKDEARIRVQFIAEEFKRIEAIVENMRSAKSAKHSIELPQGTVEVSITLPRRGFWHWLKSLLS